MVEELTNSVLAALAALLTREAESSVRQSLQASWVNLSSTLLAQAVCARLKSLQSVLHLAQEALQILTQGQVLGLFKCLGGIIGHVSAVAKILSVYNVGLAELSQESFSLCFESHPELFPLACHLIRLLQVIRNTGPFQVKVRCTCVFQNAESAKPSSQFVLSVWPDQVRRTWLEKQKVDLACNRLDDNAYILLDCQRKSKSEKEPSSNGSSTDNQRLLYGTMNLGSEPGE